MKSAPAVRVLSRVENTVFCQTNQRNFVNRFILLLLVLSACLAGSLNAQSLVMVSGNGQMVGSPSFLSSVPMVVQANSASGKPLPGVAITWTITGTGGTLPDATLVTDANGQAATHFTTTQLQPNASFAQSTITASSKYGNVSFFLITVPTTQNSNSVEPPIVTLVKPQPGDVLNALPGTTLPDAVEVRVQAGAGAQANAPIPNVSIHIVNGLDPTKPATAHCNGPNGYIYTDSTGLAKCDLVVTGQPGELSLGANAGEFHTTPTFVLKINSGPSCTYTIAPTSLSISSAGGPGTVKVTAAAGCGWAALSNVDWITITSGTSGTGNGTVAYSVGASSNVARTGTLTIAGKTFTVNQGSGGGTLTITTPATLPGGTINQSYSATLAASGGIEPYTWSITSGALPTGLHLDTSTGAISGAPTASGTTMFTVTVQDSTGATAPLALTITISTSSSTFTITNASFPDGVIGQPYKQALTSSGGVVTPFNQNPSFRVSGGTLPDGLELAKNADGSSSISGTPTTPGVSNFTLSATDAVGNTAAANFTITITGVHGQELMTVTPTSLSFTVQLGSTNIPAVQPLSITGNSGVLAYTSVVATAGGGSWLVTQNSSGNTPGSISVGITNFSNLQPGPYTGTVTISSAASNSPIAVPVTLTVLAAPSLKVTPQQINLTQGRSAGPNVFTQPVQVTAGTSGTDAEPFSAAASVNQGNNWLTVDPTTGTTPATLTISIDSGGLAIGTYTGKVVVTPTAGGTETISVTLKVINPQVLSATPAPVAFTYAQGAANPDAQTVTVSSSTGPALSLSTTVSTTDKGNWLSVTPGTGTTPQDFSVSVNPSGLAPNTYNGTITVTATDDSVTPLPIPVTLTVNPGVPTIGAVVNAASGAPGPIAPGEFVTIFGSGMGPATGVAPSGTGRIGPDLGGTQVFFDTHAAPLIYTSDGQVNAIVPYEVAGGTSTKLTVWYQGTASAGDNLRVIDAVPGIFMLNANGQGAIINQDFTINSSTNGAPIGSTVSIYATGQGQIPPGIDGQIATDATPQPPPLPVTVQIDGLQANVTYAGAAPGEVAGFMQVNATIPPGVRTGNVPIVVTVGTAPSQAGATIAIHP